MRAQGWLSAALAAALCAAAAPSAATLYRFVDENGVLHYTNVPSDPRFQAVPGTAALPPQAHGGGAPAEKYEVEITRSAESHGVDSALVKAVIKAESDFDNRAISSAGAQGLMQLMPETARLRDVNNPFNPTENIEGGVRHLKHLLTTFGDTKLALAAYNAGENAVRKYNGVPPYPETESYVATVLSHYGRYGGLSAAEGAAATRPARPQPPPIQTFVNAEGTRVFTNVPWQYLENPGWRRESPQ